MQKQAEVKQVPDKTRHCTESQGLRRGKKKNSKVVQDSARRTSAHTNHGGDILHVFPV